MKVRCTTVDPEQFPVSQKQKELFKSRIGNRSPKTFSSVQVSHEYVVYAITIIDGFSYYYVTYKNRPNDWLFIPGLCFEIIDTQLSKLWHIGVELFANGELPLTTLAIRQWIEEPMFFTNLVDCRERELRIMTDAARAMDAEHIPS